MSDFRRTVARMRALERKTILPAHSQIETEPTLVSCESPLGPVLQTRLFIPAHTVERKQPIFIGLLIGVILIVGALTFFPAVSLGPIVEQLSHGRFF